jgi:hypothetical protein
MTRPMNAVQLANHAYATEIELRAARRLIAAYERMLIGCRVQSWAGWQNGNGTNVGDAIERARKAYLKASKP